MKCIVTDCESTELVYSGIDAFMLGIPTEKVCYEHASIYNEVIALTEKVNN
jgi:hypothetical protein